MTHSRIAHFLLAVGLVAAVVVDAGTPSAISAAPSISAVRAEARRAQARLDDLAAELEERSEEYLAARAELEDTRRRVSQSREDLARAQEAVEDAEARFDNRIVSIYRNGSVDALSVFFGMKDFRDFVTRWDLFRRVSDSDARMLGKLEDARAAENRAREGLEARRAEQTALVRVAADHQAAVNEALKEQRSYLSALDAKIRTMVAAERARQVAAAKARARAAALAAARAARATGAGRTGAVHADALAVARSFIGKVEYVWGGTTPSGFDCSGLTQYSYRQVGVALPRTSREQFRVGTVISKDRVDLLEPGDLVFFGRDGDPDRVHHVGIYSGDGMYVHAPQTGMKVSESSLLERIATRHDYVGARRP